MSSLRRALGAAAHELPGFLWGMRPSRRDAAVSAPWVFIRNRHEHLARAKEGPGVRCDWQWTSDLHAPRVFPSLGLWLMRRSLRDWPIELRNTPGPTTGQADVSFIIGHRGSERLPHLLETLRSIAGQRGTACECVIVEQSGAPEAQRRLPPWVRYAHTPPPHVDMPYSRSWAFNVGAHAAAGRVLVFHDNDMLVPRDYAAEIVRRVHRGAEVLNLKRFVFYLTARHSERITATGMLTLDEAPERVVQNLEAGGSLAITREVFDALGGFDETFVGWGGEDNELWDRAHSRAVDPYGCLPILHLWHAPQPEKTQGTAAPGVRLYQELVARPPLDRIGALSLRPRGSREGPHPPYVRET